MVAVVEAESAVALVAAVVVAPSNVEELQLVLVELGFFFFAGDLFH